MKKLYKNLKTQAGWHRIIAWLLAISMVLIPVKFPGAAQAVGQTATETAPGGYFADDFSSDALLRGVTYKWNYLGNAAISGGALNLGDESKSNSAAYLSAVMGEGEAARDISANWTDYTITAVIDRSGVPASNYMGGITGRITKNADGTYSYYAVILKGNNPTAEDTKDSDTVSVTLVKMVGKNSLVANLETVPASGSVSSAKAATNEVKVTFEDNRIRCWVDGELALDYTDTDEPIMSGSVGTYQQHYWTLKFNSYKVDFADGSSSFCDDFTDTRFETGVTTKWDGSQVSSVTKAIQYKWLETLNVNGTTQVHKAIGGTYNIWYDTLQSNKNSTSWIILDATEGESKPLEAMTEYAIDLDYVRHNWRSGTNAEGNGAPWILFGLQETGNATAPYTGFGIKLHQNGPYVGKITVNKLGYVTLAGKPDQTSKTGLNAGAEVWNHIKLQVSGTKMEITLSNANKSGTLTWEHADLQPGKMGMAFECSYVDDTNKEKDATKPLGFEIDNFTITSGGNQIFKDDFADESVFTGEEQTYTVSKNVPTAADVDFTWTEKLQGTSTTADIKKDDNGNYTYFCDPWNHSWLMANVTDGKSNPMDAMTDYSISLDYVRHNIRGDDGYVGEEGYAAPWLLFGMQPVENDATYIWKGYGLKLHSGGPYCFRLQIDKNGKIVTAPTDNLGSQKGGSAAENWRNVKLDVAGTSFTVTLSDLEGNPLSSKTYQGSYSAAGVFGLYSEYNKVDTISRGYEYDNLKVTRPDGKVFFEETFTPAENQTKAAYLAETKTFEGVFSTPNWHISNGVLSGVSSGSANMLASEFCGTTDYAKDWLDYAIDADIMLGSAASTAGFIANYNAGTYYELRLSTAGLGIYLVTPTDETQLAYKAMTLNPNQWYLTKLEVDNDGKTLMGYIDSSLEFEVNLTDNALAKGTMGVVINGSAKFDNFAAYSVELSDSRIFKTYKFQGDDFAVLDSDWAIDGTKWELKDDKLVNKEADVAALLKKATLDNYNAALLLTFGDGTNAEVIGRYDPTNETGYVLGLYSDESIRLKKQTAADTYTPIYAATREELYAKGVRLIDGQNYTLNLRMYEDEIWCFIGDLRLFAYKDSDYESGVTAISGTNGTQIVSLTTSEAFAVPKLYLEDMQGNAVSGLTAYLGHTPDLKPYRIKAVYYNNNGEQIDEKFADLDAIPMEGTFSTTESGSVKVFYDYAELTINYTVDQAADEIAAIKAELDAMNVGALTLDDEADVKDLVARYNALSFTQKESFTVLQKKAVIDAQEKIEVLRYPELADDPVVFRDDFDTVTDGKYVNDYLTNGSIDPGEWYIENGAMVMYKNRTVNTPTSFTTYNELVKRNFAVKSISVDVQLIDELAWAGINFNAKDGKHYAFTVTDKNDRIQLSGGAKTTTIYANSTDLPAEERFEFEAGVWYNLRVTFDRGLIKCYVNDRLWITYQDEADIRTGAINENGTIMFHVSENWVKFDNLVVRGAELQWKESDQWYTVNGNLTAGSYQDNFHDETAYTNPSHWLELTTTDFWKVMPDGDDKVYGSTGTTAVNSSSWLHVFETDVVYKTKLKATALGQYPIAGLTARLNADESYIKAGFDFTLNQWFIKTRYGTDFEEVVTYGSAGTFEKNTWYDLTLDVKGTSIKLYVGNTEVAKADAGKKVSPGRVGVFTEQCDVQIDDVDLVLTSGQGRVQDGVMEQYTAQAGATSGTLFQVLPLEDGRFLLNQDSTHYISNDGGMTWQPDAEYKSFRGGSQLILSNGHIINVKCENLDADGDKGGNKGIDDSRFTTYLSVDGGKTWEKVSTVEYLNEKFLQPAEHLSEVVLDNGTHRIFYTQNNQAGTFDGLLNHMFTSYVFYSDDEGVTWNRSVNTAANNFNLTCFAESHVLKTNGALPGDPLVHYSTYNSSNTLRYTLSYDDGVTWEGDYAIADIPCGWNSMTIEQDRETGIYYMATFFNIPAKFNYGFPRLRVVLLSSEDGLNWDFVCDVDRWGDVSDADMGHIMQAVNMYLCVDDEYIFVSFSRSDAYGSGGSHNDQVGRLYRFEKSKLKAYEKWPEEYIINPKELVSIEAKPLNTYLDTDKEFDPAGSKLILHHYNGTTTEIDMSEAFVNEVVGPKGEALVYVDYKTFRSTFTLTKVANTAPVVSGVENGKAYCASVTVTITDADIKSVTLNGKEVALTDGKLVIAPANGEQTLVVTDQLGNVTTVKITVNGGHTGGTATCTDKAKCSVCGEAYGELNADNHTGEAAWTKTADKHSKAYDCCGKVVVAEAAHSGGTATCEDKAKCTVCGESYGELLTTHTGGTATCEDKAVCTVCGEAYGELEAHKGGTATCADKAKCSVCGKQYGELNAAKHEGEAKWTKTADKHTKTYDCCGEVVVAEEAHKLTDGKCECGYEAPAPVEPGEIENTTDEDKNACGGSLDVKDEHLADKLLTEEEKKEVAAGADINIYLTVEDISDKVSAEDKALVEKNLNGMKVGLYLDIDLEKQVGNKTPVKITQTNGGVTVTITVPNELRNADEKVIRTYKVIRVHDGKTDVLDATYDAKTNKLSFQTDKFSTYTLVYSDAPSSDNSNTGDNTAIVLFGGLLALSALAAAVLLVPDIRKKLMGK